MGSCVIAYVLYFTALPTSITFRGRGECSGLLSSGGTSGSDSACVVGCSTSAAEDEEAEEAPDDCPSPEFHHEGHVFHEEDE